MDRSRKATRQRMEATLQYQSVNEAQRIAELDEQNLAERLAVLDKLRQSPKGKLELLRRAKAFGECQRSKGETTREFYDKLSRWLDRPLPQTKVPLHPPRQVEEWNLQEVPSSPLEPKKAKAMATQAGVWIDHKQAVVVLLNGAGQEIKKIAFAIGQPVGEVGKTPPKKKYTPNDFVAENKLQRKATIDRKGYFDEVIACLGGATALLILGPGEAKGEFQKHLKARKLRDVEVEVETADKLTDRQVAAKVRQHFAPSTTVKAAAAKKAATKPVKKAAKKAAPKKRPKPATK